MKISLRTVLFLAGVSLTASNPCALAHTNVTAQQARDLIESTNDLIVVDVREPYEYCDAGGHIPGALNYPWSSGVLRDRYEELPADGPILVVCRSGGRSNAAASFLDSNGFSMIYDMLRGMSAWQWETVPCKYAGGSGTPDDPYQIATAEDLIALGETPEDYDKHFILTADIDLSGHTFDRALIAPATGSPTPDFQGVPFTGALAGNNHVIRHLHIEGTHDLGLFGYLQSRAVVSYLTLENGSIKGSVDWVGGLAGRSEGTVSHCYSNGEVAGGAFVGGLVGGNDGAISNCFSTGAVTGENGWLFRSVGGLVGNNRGSISNCYSTGKVTGHDNVGGLVGFSHDGSVSNCYSTGAVVGTDDVGGLIGGNRGSISNCKSSGAVTGDGPVGGLVGDNWGSVSNCYGTGAVTGERGVGGLAGVNWWGSVSNCYSTGTVTGGGYVGGLVGGNTGTVVGSFWDIESSRVAHSPGGAGLTIAEMMDPEWIALQGWANDPNWILDPHQDYPRLAWEGTQGQVVPEPTIDWIVGQGTVEMPYEIEDPNQLLIISKASLFWQKNIVLMADLDVAEILWPRAVVQDFTGIFDGNGHVIKNLRISGNSYLGFFGSLVEGGMILNLGLSDVDIVGTGGRVAGLVGRNYTGIVVNCHSNGHVTGHDDVGGLVGENYYSSVSDCYSTGVITGDYSVGGLVGGNYDDCNVLNCYSTCEVRVEEVGGGLVGGNSGSVSDCYSTGRVTGNNSRVGGLVGENFNGDGRVLNCYSTGVVTGLESVGGLVGSNDGSVSNCNSSNAVTGDFGVGGLVGDNHNKGNISNCHSPGMVIGNIDVGGLAGDNYEGSVSNCYSSGTVIGNEDVGGLVGYNEDSNVANSYTTGAVTGNINAGGLVGYNSNATVSNSYSTGAVTGQEGIGGLVGRNDEGSVSSSYSTGTVTGGGYVGGLVGDNRENATVTSSFWDMETSGQTANDGGVGKTTPEMQTSTTFLDAGWDFVDETANGTDDIWWIDEGLDYPRLWWEAIE